MNRIVKYQSVQSGVFNGSKNLVDFEIMDNTQHNFKNSYVNLRGNVNTTDTTPRAFGKAVYNYNFKWIDGTGAPSNYKFTNEAIIKNARLTCDTQSAPLEDTRLSDILRTQLAHFTSSDDDVYGQSYKDISQGRTQGDLIVGLGLDLVKEGSRMSKNNEVSVQIPLNKFLELGNMENFPTNKLGKTRLHLELNLDQEKKLSISQFQGSDMAGDIGNNDYLLFDDILAGSTGDVETLTLTQEFVDLKYSPFWVGQLLEITADKVYTAQTPSTTTAIVVQRMITNISYNNQEITITLDESLTTLTVDEELIDISYNGVNWATASLEWSQCELVLEENGASVDMDELQYATYKNEEDNGNGLTTFSRQYNVEPECFNLYVCLPDSALGDLWSTMTGGIHDSYRIRSDNVDLTDRDIEVYSALYNDRIAMTLLNANLQLKSLNPCIMDVKNAYYNNRIRGTPPTVFLGNPLPQTPTNKLVQLTINGDSTLGGVNSVQLYKQVFKSIKL